MNQDFADTYPPVNRQQQQQPSENGYPGHLGSTQWPPTSNQTVNQYASVPPAAPYYNLPANDCYYPQQQQQYPATWNAWPAEQNNNTTTYNPSLTSAPLNPQADPWLWNSSSGPDYSDSNHDPQQTAPGWGYVTPQEPQVGYQAWQGHDPSAWQHSEQPASLGLWEQQQQQPVQDGELAHPEYLSGSGVICDDATVDRLADQLEHCSFSRPVDGEGGHSGDVVTVKQPGDESNQEVPPSFQQVESVLESLVPAPSDLSDDPGYAPPLILPRKGSLFQPPVPSQHLQQEAPPTLSPAQQEASPLFQLQQDIPAVSHQQDNTPEPPVQPPLSSVQDVPVPDSTSSPESLPISIKNENDPHELYAPPINHETNLETPDNLEKPQPESTAGAHPVHVGLLESMAARIHPLHPALPQPELMAGVQSVHPAQPESTAGVHPLHLAQPESIAARIHPLHPAQPLPESPAVAHPVHLESTAARVHPLHLALHRQHFSNDVDDKSRTTLWENPIVDSIPNFTLMPLKSGSVEPEPLRTLVEEFRPPVEFSVLKPSAEEPLKTAPMPFLVPELPPRPDPVVSSSEEIISPPPTFPISSAPPSRSAPSSASSSTLPSPEKKAASPQPARDDPRPRGSNSSLNDSRWPGERSPGKSRNEPERNRRVEGYDAGRQSKDGRDYDNRQHRDDYDRPRRNERDYPASRQPRDERDYEGSRSLRDERDYGTRSPLHRKQDYPDQPTDPRPSRPDYYSLPPGGYSSRPSSRASEPPGDSYYDRTPSRLSETGDERGYDGRRQKYYDYDRKYEGRRDSDQRLRGYDERGYEDGRRRDDREYERRGTYEREPGRRDYVDGGADYDYSKMPYSSEKQYSRSRREEDYYSRPQKGYDYYPGWQDSYTAYYQQYYNNYRASNYGMRHNYGYHKELYETDPKYRQQVDAYQAYWSAHQSQMGYDSDHHSLHSGRSSVNDELRKDSRRIELSQDFDDSPSVTDSISQPTPPPRMTPVKFSCAHPIGRLHPGHIVTVLPSHSTSLVSSVNIYDIQNAFQFDHHLKDMKDFPGPLIGGQTHKKDVMSFCQQKVHYLQTTREQVVDRTSQILMWELLILLVRQNGNVIGSDIAELLLKDVHSGSSAQTPTSTHTTGTSPLDMLSEDLRDGPSNNAGSPAGTPSPDEGIVVSQDRTLLNKPLPVHQVTQKFTEYLLYGNKKDALEWAVRHDLWGHALFLAYRMGSHSHASLMTRFANSLPMNDPLQTLYQLMSGRQPASVTSVADEKWGDWRPHLAMILSNPTPNPQVDHRSTITLGDTLAQKGCLSAAHFCYLMAQVEFGTYGNNASKIVLLGSNHTLPFEKFASNEAIQLTEIYEYALSLANPNYMQPNFQPYKFLYATRLAESGYVKEALHYCEVMTSLTLRFPGYVSHSLFKQIDVLASRLKYHDPHYTQGTGELEELGDPPWLTQLQQHLSPGGDPNVNSAALTPQGSFSQEQSQPEQPHIYEYQQQQQPQQPPQPPQQEEAVTSGGANTSDTVPMMSTSAQNETWNNQFYSYPNSFSYTASPGSTEPMHDAEQLPQLNSPQGHVDTEGQAESSLGSSYYDQAMNMQSIYSTQGPPLQSSQSLYGGRQRQDSVDSTFGGSRKGSSSSTIANAVSSAREEAGSNRAVKPDTAKKPDATKPQAGRSWFGNIFNKLLPKGPNQMILPDDKKPTIVWDDKKGAWVDQDSNGEDVANSNLPPPKDSELIPSMPTMGSLPPGQSAPPGMGDQNRFQRPKLRGMRQNYVDILNSSNTSRGSASSPGPVSDPIFAKMEQSTNSAPNFFIPPPMPITDGAPDPMMQSNPGGYLSTNRIESIPEPESNQSPLLNPADYGMDPHQTAEPMRKPVGGRLGGRRAYPS